MIVFCQHAIFLDSCLDNYFSCCHALFCFEMHILKLNELQLAILYTIKPFLKIALFYIPLFSFLKHSSHLKVYISCR